MLENELKRLIETYGREQVEASLLEHRRDGSTLSIVADSGMHRQPSELIIGERYDFSSGMIDVQSDVSVESHLLRCCEGLADKLREKAWTEVRLFFSGHALLGAYAKLTVYRVTHLDTVDFGFFGSDGFRRIGISLRKHLLEK